MSKMVRFDTKIYLSKMRDNPELRVISIYRHDYKDDKELPPIHLCSAIVHISNVDDTVQRLKRTLLQMPGTQETSEIN